MKVLLALCCTFSGNHTVHWQLFIQINTSSFSFFNGMFGSQTLIWLCYHQQKKKKKVRSAPVLTFLVRFTPHPLSQAPCIASVSSPSSTSLSSSPCCAFIRMETDKPVDRLKRHTYQYALSLHLSFSLSVETWPLSVHGRIYHSPSPAAFLPGSVVPVTTQPCRSVKV